MKNIKKILITGNMGYVGPVLVNYLRTSLPDAELIGFDNGYFGHSLTGVEYFPERGLTAQYYGDVRHFPTHLLHGVDAVVHLAAISNDPMGKEFEEVTEAINRKASVALALMAADAGVKNFVFASSCSMYGQAEGGARKETDPTNPLTAYARSKIGTEHDLGQADLKDMIFTSLRFATACGWSSRLRLDLVLNDFVACAITNKQITVLSDGTPWRPLIDVEDMARAILWAVERPATNGGKFLAVNAGCNEGNYQVKDLADAVARIIPGISISINENAPIDNRSYSVDFSLYKALAPEYQPKLTLEDSINRLYKGLESMGFKDATFRESTFMRLNTLRRHIAQGIINKELRWVEA